MASGMLTPPRPAGTGPDGPFPTYGPVESPSPPQQPLPIPSRPGPFDSHCEKGEFGSPICPPTVYFTSGASSMVGSTIKRFVSLTTITVAGMIGASIDARGGVPTEAG